MRNARPICRPSRAVAEIEILIEAEGWEKLPEAEAIARRAGLAAIGAGNGSPPALVAVLLTDDAAMQRLNAHFRGSNKPTNVLSFPAPAMPSGAGDAESLFLGDLALGYETCAAEAMADGKSLGDHLSHLVVHGVLHLMGHDHETEAEADEMEDRERAILASLGISDPYAGAEGGATG
ncbi:MAG: rRNA maturation RNase YbeY [Methylobacterium sp.]|nr:rRNA maturation RNase YbeY [Methylobacterium sp.]MCA3599895.1 rRNA maturation RNase YbeY [Methylobacterium sp.]MCA3605447.1 rRNA maturation RNase YbeY [Methylobacterium sp.]MCA3608128.1 rRNA maturation RNase YbeY [Methylobacterium sp.]MCA3616852.1 rRNA maturation RNase YbeY [Methylobacterium sp.]